MKIAVVATSFLFIPIILSIPNAYGRAEIFVGGLEEHAGHGGIYIPTSYTGIRETYTMVIRNDRNLSTTEVQIILPKGMELISAGNKEGWEVFVLKPPSVPAPVLILNGSSISKGTSEQFTLTVRNPADVFVYYFVVVQTYDGGESDVWRPWVQIISPTNVAGIEISTIAASVVVVGMALPFVERAVGRIVRKPA